MKGSSLSLQHDIEQAAGDGIVDSPLDQGEGMENVQQIAVILGQATLDTRPLMNPSSRGPDPARLPVC